MELKIKQLTYKSEWTISDRIIRILLRNIASQQTKQKSKTDCSHDLLNIWLYSKKFSTSTRNKQ